MLPVLLNIIEYNTIQCIIIMWKTMDDGTSAICDKVIITFQDGNIWWNTVLWLLSVLPITSK